VVPLYEGLNLIDPKILIMASQQAKSQPQPSYILRGHASQIHYTSFIRSNSRLITGDAEGWIVVWSLAIKRPVAVWRAHEGSILGAEAWGTNKIITYVLAFTRALNLNTCSLIPTPSLIRSPHMHYIFAAFETERFLKGSLRVVSLSHAYINAPAESQCRHGKDNKLIVWKLSEEDEKSMSLVLPVDTPPKPRNQPWLLHMLHVNTMNFCSFAQAPMSLSAPSSDDVEEEVLIAVPNTLTSESVSVSYASFGHGYTDSFPD
jgi:hypothetical protein